MISPALFLLPLTAVAAACRPRNQDIVSTVPTFTLDNVVSHSAGFLAPTPVSSAIVHRPDDLMAPSAISSEPIHRPDDFMAPTTTPELRRPDDFMAPPTAFPSPSPLLSSVIISSSSSITPTPTPSPSPSSSAANTPGLDFSFPAPSATPAPTSTPASAPVLNPSLISWASWLSGPPPMPALTYASFDISFASWVNPSTLITTPTPSAPTPTPYLSGSNPGDFLLCVDTNFSGECTYMHSVTFSCQNLPPHLQRRATSIRPDKNQTCIFYDQEDCMGRADWLRWPGTSNMRGRRFDERVVSWMCREDGCEGVRGPGGCSEDAEGRVKVWG